VEAIMSSNNKENKGIALLFIAMAIESNGMQ
jgi:hypothetical protein